MYLHPLTAKNTNVNSVGSYIRLWDIRKVADLILLKFIAKAHLTHTLLLRDINPASILHKSIAGRYRSVS